MRRAALAFTVLAVAASVARAGDPPPSAPAPPLVQVVGPDGRPVTHAALVEVPALANGVVDEAGPAIAVADARGNLPLRRPSAPGAWLVVRAPGFGLAPFPTDVGTLRLEATKPIAGSLKREDGAPLGPVEVIAEIPAFLPFLNVDGDNGLREDPTPQLFHRARPDAAGRFAFETLPPGRWRIVVRRPDGAWASLGAFNTGDDVPARVLPKATTIRGRVLETAHGKPVVGLRIRLHALGAVRDDHPLGLIRSPNEEGPETLAETVTDPGGRFVVADLPRGLYEARPLDPDVVWDGESPRIEVDSLAPMRLESWWMLRRGALVGAVKDAATRKPVAGATVLVIAAPDAARVPGGRVRPMPVETDAAGAFRFAGIAPGEDYRIVVGSQGHSPHVAGPYAVAGGRDEAAGDLLLVRSWRMEVEVVDVDAKPLEGAHVRSTPSSRPVIDFAFDPAAGAFFRVGTTDANGRAALEDLPEGDQQVVVGGPGFVPSTTVVGESKPGTTQRVRIALARTVAVDGRVESVDGPLPPVLVRATVRDTGETREATPEKGVFRLEDLAPSAIDVEVTSPDRQLVYARRERYLPGSGAALVLPIAAPHKVEGVADALARDGVPASVRLESLRYDATLDAYLPALVAQVELEKGVEHAPFAFPTVPRGTYSLRLVQGLSDSGPIPLTMRDADVTGIELRLPVGGRVEGVVLDERRSAAAFGAQVRLTRLQGEGAAPVPPEVSVANEDGHFVFEGIAPGLWRLDVFDREAVGTTVVVRIAGGDSVVVDGLMLVGGARIRGRVADERRRPVGALPIRVWSLPALEDRGFLRTREDGTFRSGPLLPGRYRLVAYAGLADRPGFEVDVDLIEGEEADVDLSPLGGGRIDGAVRRRGNAVPGVGVELTHICAGPCESMSLKTLTDAFGQFHWDGLEEGAYRMRLLEGAVRTVVPVFVGRNQRVTRDLELGEGGIVGIVRFAGGEPVAGAEVVAVPIASPAFDPEDVSAGHVRTGPDGRFDLRGLPVAAYRVFVTPLHRPSHVIARVIAEPAGQERDVEVWIGLGGRLDLRVKDDRGRGVAVAQVWIENPAGVALHPRPYYTQPSGRLIVEGLPEGPARIRVRARGYGTPFPSPLVLRDGISTSHEITLRPAGSLRVVVTAGRDPSSRARVTVRRLPTREVVLPPSSLRRPQDTTGWGSTPRTGVVVVEDLEEGDYVVEVTAGSQLAPASVPARVRAGAATDVHVALQWR